jgi:hypothetical protein
LLTVTIPVSVKQAASVSKVILLAYSFPLALLVGVWKEFLENIIGIHPGRRMDTANPIYRVRKLRI